jgi:hypothetical protein
MPRTSGDDHHGGTRIDQASAARRMLAEAQVFTQHLPAPLNSSEPLQILLWLFSAEADLRTVNSDQIRVPSSLSPEVTRRWLAALTAAGLVLACDNDISLSDHGRTTMIEMLSRIVDPQHSSG